MLRFQDDEMRKFVDRAEGGRALAERLRHYGNRSDVLILALPRGGVPVGFELARELQAPLDIFMVRKLGTPGQEELAMGAVASGGLRVLNASVIESLGISDETLDQVTRKELAELQRREAAYRGHSPEPEIMGKVVILVDDGLATGSTMRVACKALKQRKPQRLVVASPVGPPSTCDEFRDEADEAICVLTPEPFYAVGAWYEKFDQTSDAEVRMLLEKANLIATHDSRLSY